MTETSTVVCMQPREVHQHIDGSAGRLISGTSIKVVGQDGKELGYDEPGELHVKGPQTYVTCLGCKHCSLTIK
jgi:long-subunit acyl-CoA synthetase (AMP-forming)